MLFQNVEWKNKCLKNAQSSDLTHITDANFHYTECGMAKSLQESCK